MIPLATDAAAAAPAACADREPLARLLLRLGARVAGGSALLGLAFGLMESSWSAVVDNVVYATCIGIAIFLAHALPRGGGRARAQWTMRDHALRALLSIPVGFAVGVEIASLLRGHAIGLAAFQHVSLFAGMTTIAAGLGFIYYFWSTRRLADQAAAQSDALRTAAEAKLLLLRTQIEPHMLFNTLANLRSLIEVDPPRAQAMVDELIVYLRATLSASRRPTTTLAEEFAQLRAYLELMRVRMPQRLAYTLDLPAELADADVPPMLLQPIVENAIRHGLEPRVAGGRIDVTARRDGERLELQVVDDGIGCDDATLVAGYGTTHVRERLETLYGDAARFAIGAAPGGGTRVRLVLPFSRPSGRS